MMTIKYCSCLLILLFAATALAGQTNCSMELPVGVLGMDFSLLNGLSAGDVTVRVGKLARNIESVNYNTGPRRILFVLDTSPSLAADARKAQVKLVNYIVSSARKGDSFALITAHGIPHSVKFGESPDALLKAANDVLNDPPKDKNKGQGILDAMMEG